MRECIITEWKRHESSGIPPALWLKPGHCTSLCSPGGWFVKARCGILQDAVRHGRSSIVARWVPRDASGREQWCLCIKG